jgi:hypothetical protein
LRKELNAPERDLREYAELVLQLVRWILGVEGNGRLQRRERIEKKKLLLRESLDRILEDGTGLPSLSTQTKDSTE